jgi:hypothetical protein
VWSRLGAEGERRGKGVALIGSKDSASARARELPRMGAKTASRLGCGPDWEQRDSEGARVLLADWVAVMIDK